MNQLTPFEKRFLASMYSSDEQKMLRFFRPSELSKIWKDDFKSLLGEFPSEKGKEKVSFEQEKAKSKSSYAELTNVE